MSSFAEIISTVKHAAEADASVTRQTIGDQSGEPSKVESHELIQHVKDTWSHVDAGTTTLAEKAEVAGEIAVALTIGGLFVYSGLARQLTRLTKLAEIENASKATFPMRFGDATVREFSRSDLPQIDFVANYTNIDLPVLPPLRSLTFGRIAKVLVLDAPDEKAVGFISFMGHTIHEMAVLPRHRARSLALMSGAFEHISSKPGVWKAICKRDTSGRVLEGLAHRNVITILSREHYFRDSDRIRFRLNDRAAV